MKTSRTLASAAACEVPFAKFTKLREVPVHVAVARFEPRRVKTEQLCMQTRTSRAKFAGHSLSVRELFMRIRDPVYVCMYARSGYLDMFSDVAV